MLIKVSWSFGNFSASVRLVLFPMCTDSVLSFPVIKQTERRLNTKLSNSKNTQVTASPVKVGLFLVWKKEREGWSQAHDPLHVQHTTGDCSLFHAPMSALFNRNEHPHCVCWKIQWGCRWLCFCSSQRLMEAVAVHSNFLWEHWVSAEPSLSGRLEMWKDRLQTSGWTSEMWIALSLIKSIQQGVVCSISLLFEDWNEFRWQEILPVCQRTAGCQRILETENCKMAACFCSTILTDLKYQTGPCWFDVLKYSTVELKWKKPLGSDMCTAGIGLVWIGGG